MWDFIHTCITNTLQVLSQKKKKNTLQVKIIKSNILLDFGNLFKESFYEIRKKKTINVLIVFFIFHKSCVKIVLKWIVDQYSKDTH